MELSEEQKQTFYRDGFLKLPGIVSRELVDEATKAINASLGNEGIDPVKLPIYRSQSYCPELTDKPAITNLLHRSPLWSIAESMIGAGQIQPVNHGQIALRFPALKPAQSPVPHLDGMHTANNGVPAGQINNFTALIGVFLSDIPHDFMGNFSAWPGTHCLYENYFRRHTPQSLLQGMPDVELPATQQITAQAGDAVLCHYQLAHGIAGNNSAAIRYGIFFRLLHVQHETLRWECMTDIWKEWAGMQESIQHAER
ncbi:MAG TPA: hypothetical protein VGN34_11035 [Ktedonobacteraceae bacterium]|jgi:hypothetical protein